VLRKGL